MKVKDIPILKQKVLEILPITQAEITKILGIDHRDVSKLIGEMIKEHIIKKKRVDRTYLLELNGHEEEKDFTLLLCGDKFTPCAGCSEDCDPTLCQKLTDWITGDNKKEEKNNIKEEKEEKNNIKEEKEEKNNIKEEKEEKNNIKEEKEEKNNIKEEIYHILPSFTES